MTISDRKSARNGTRGLNDRPQADFLQMGEASILDHASFQSLVTTAILAATAFRLRDQDGLTESLRRLVLAVQPFEVTPTED
ncbi:MAG: hypothetical protein AAGA21_25435 [Pseudomonadota bacterium]